jgi:hypothetical protein
VDILGPVKDLYTAYNLIKQVWALGRALRRLSESDTVQNTIAEVRVKARSTLMPAILERLDDGTNPEYQHLRIDLSPKFTQERIKSASTVYYRDSQSFDNLIQQFKNAVIEQASRGAQVGEERTSTVMLQLLDDFAYYTYVVRGQVGGDWILVRDPKKKINRGQLWAASQARGELLTQLLKEARAERKARRKK